MFGKIIINRFVLIGLLALLSSGCAETSMMYSGNTVTSVPVVTLQSGGPNAGVWETFDMTIAYNYTRNSDVVEVDGQIALNDHYQLTYERLWRLDVYLFFVDEDSKVLETSFITRTAGSVPEERFSFSQSYKVPPGTTGLSFGYSGVAGEKRTRTTFYELPLE